MGAALGDLVYQWITKGWSNIDWIEVGAWAVSGIAVGGATLLWMMATGVSAITIGMIAMAFATGVVGGAAAGGFYRLIASIVGRQVQVSALLLAMELEEG